MRRSLAPDNTQSMLALLTAFDRKSITRHSFSLIIKNHLVSLHQKIIIEIVTARHRSFFHKNLTGSNASQTDLLHLLVFYGELIDFQ